MSNEKPRAVNFILPRYKNPTLIYVDDAALKQGNSTLGTLCRPTLAVCYQIVPQFRTFDLSFPEFHQYFFIF